MMKFMLIILTILIEKGIGQDGGGTLSYTHLALPPTGTTSCGDGLHVISYYHYMNQSNYLVVMYKKVSANSSLELRFDSEAFVELKRVTASSSKVSASKGVFTLNFFQDVNLVEFEVEGPSKETVPYFKSIKLDGEELCDNPSVGYLGKHNPDQCGVRKIEHTALIAHGQATKEGDWPWHAAIYKLEKSSIMYICGGTLISKRKVLTAAHCVTINGIAVTPEILSVVLGKYNLVGGDLASQEREVQSVTVHEEYAPKTHLNNDIALIKLREEAFYTNYVQAACLWYKEANAVFTGYDVCGMVVGWGFELKEALAPQLRQTMMPIISDDDCVKTNPSFYANVLKNNMKFCAGWGNGTSACNGDSGGGFVVFVPEPAKNATDEVKGAWHIRGIVSLSPSRKNWAVCDPYQYTVFTDVELYITWIERHLHS